MTKHAISMVSLLSALQAHVRSARRADRECLILPPGSYRREVLLLLAAAEADELQTGDLNHGSNLRDVARQLGEQPEEASEGGADEEKASHVDSFQQDESSRVLPLVLPAATHEVGRLLRLEREVLLPL